MKKLLILLSILMLLTLPAALAENPLPPVEYLNESLLIDLPDGGRFVVYVYDHSGYEGYRETAVGWERQFSSHLFDEPRHLRLDDADPPAYSLVNEDGTKALHYTWNGETFDVCGWRGNGWNVAIQGSTLVYTGQHGNTITVPLAGQLWLHDYEYLPKAPEEARELYAISQREAAALADGFTLCSYGTSNGGWEAWARYLRITEDDRCQTREITLIAGQGVTRTLDSLLIPLSANKAAELREIIASGTAMDNKALYEWELLVAEGTFDLSRMPVTGKIIDGDLQTTCLILLTEENGQRYLNSITYGRNGGYHIERSPALPANTQTRTSIPSTPETGISSRNPALFSSAIP